LSPKDPDSTQKPLLDRLSFDKHTHAYGNWLTWDEVVTYLKLSKLGSGGTTWKNANCTFPVEDAEMKRSAI
jgi:hypothetical protein